MAVNKRRPGPAKGATYRKRAEIEKALDDAAIELCMEGAPETITAGALAERAGLSPAYVSRYGGGMQALLTGAAAKVFIAELRDWSPGSALASPRVTASVRLVAYLLANGTDPRDLFVDEAPIISQIADNFEALYGIDSAEAKRAARIAIVFFLGHRAFGEASGLTDDDAAYFAGRFDQMLRELGTQAPQPVPPSA